MPDPRKEITNDSEQVVKELKKRVGSSKEDINLVRDLAKTKNERISIYLEELRESLKSPTTNQERHNREEFLAYSIKQQRLEFYVQLKQGGLLPEKDSKYFDKKIVCLQAEILLYKIAESKSVNKSNCVLAKAEILQKMEECGVDKKQRKEFERNFDRRMDVRSNKHISAQEANVTTFDVKSTAKQPMPLIESNSSSFKKH